MSEILLSHLIIRKYFKIFLNIDVNIFLKFDILYEYTQNLHHGQDATQGQF